MSTSTQIFKTCNNCKKEISTETWCIHDAVCSRHNYYCENCENIISIREKDAHDANCPENYINCGDCDEIIKLKDYKDHKINKCENRLLECEYCELSMKYCKLVPHKIICGSRTRKCDTCGKFIQLQYYKDHDCKTIDSSADNNSSSSKSDCSEKKETRIVKCPFCDLEFKSIAIQSHIFEKHPEF